MTHTNLNFLAFLNSLRNYIYKLRLSTCSWTWFNADILEQCHLMYVNLKKTPYPTHKSIPTPSLPWYDNKNVILFFVIANTIVTILLIIINYIPINRQLQLHFTIIEHSLYSNWQMQFTRSVIPIEFYIYKDYIRSWYIPSEIL